MIPRRGRKTDYGTVDYYKYYKTKGGKLDKQTFSKILNEINIRLMDEVINGYTLKFPDFMGALMIKVSKPTVEFKDGKLFTKRPMDYAATLKMWEEDPSTKEQRKIVRHLNSHTNGLVYKLHYCKSVAKYTNKSVYNASINRYYKRKFAQLLKEGFAPEGVYIKHSNGSEGRKQRNINKLLNNV